MKILLFDTESTGLADFNARARDPKQPHIVQLAAELFDENGNTIEFFETLVKPDGWTIPQEAIAVHGITNELATEKGIPEAEMAKKLFEMVKQADLIVAFNAMFDRFLARIALRRHNLFTDADDAAWKAHKTYDPMREMTNLCKLPGKFAGKYKWPKLQEAYRHAFGEDFVGAHGAAADLQATKKIYFWLKAREAILTNSEKG